MKDNNYRELMNAKPLVPITKEYNKAIQKGTLIGFKGLSNIDKITAAYPIYRVIGEEIQFELYKSSSNGRSVIDNTFFGNDKLYINAEPIIVPMDIKCPQTWYEDLDRHFNFKSNLE